MACSSCSCDPCNCSQPANCQQCECPDPGSISPARHLSVLDYKLCDKRLTNTAGVLVNNITGSGAGNIQWTNSPCVLVPSVEISEGMAFANILAALGDLGCWSRLVPAGSADGYLKASSGQWVIQDVPTANIPDPLNVANLSVTTLATIAALNVTGTLCAPGTASGTIVSVLGLDTNGCIVKSSGGSTSVGVSLAMYYENTEETAAATPNSTIGNGAYAQIGNEIFDSDSIAAVQSVDTIKIVMAGKYFVLWGAYYDTPSSPRDVNLNLEINGATPSIPGFGPGRLTDSSPQVRYPVNGFTIRTLAANDTLKLKCESSVATNNPLKKVKMLLVRFSS